MYRYYKKSILKIFFIYKGTKSLIFGVTINNEKFHDHEIPLYINIYMNVYVYQTEGKCNIGQYRNL